MRLERLDFLHRINVPIITPVFVTPPVYDGPGDVVTGAVGWWGLRAYDSAARGTNCCRIRRNSDNAEQDFITLPSGAVDRASISTFLTSTTGAFVTLYDQTASARPVTQATAGSQPTVNLSGIGSLVTADFSSASSHLLLASAGLTQNVPLTISAGAKTVNHGSQQSLHLDGGSGVQLGFRNSANNQVFVYVGSVLAATAADGSFHSFHAIANGASSDMNVDGSSTTGSGGANPGVTGTTQIGGGNFNGQFLELGIWPGSFSGTQMTNMDTNQSTFWGY